jgi:lipid-A-disaccharide synthase
MLRAAWKLAEHLPDAPRIKYVAPQVFAARRGRARVTAEHFDHLLAIHPFDAPYFQPHGLPVTFVGNPALERDLSGDGPGFRQRHAIAPEAELLLILFGSRRSELRRLFPRFADAVRRLAAERPQLRFVTALSPSIADEARDLIAAASDLPDIVIAQTGERRDAFHAADAALACSGTVTLELARIGVPTVTAYRLGWLAWAAARYVLMKAKYISLANLAADEMLIPEYVQTRCTGVKLASAVSALLDDSDGRAVLSRRLRETTETMAGATRPSREAAAAVLSLAQKKAGQG